MALFLPQGALSPHVVEGLAHRGISPDSTSSCPTPLNVADLEWADLRIALYEPEHRSLLRRRFPAWENRVMYWQVPDLGEMDPEEGLTKIETEVLRLVEELAQGRGKKTTVE